jgi:CubicO group peptidase (beta-lactamase class C family)
MDDKIIYKKSYLDKPISSQQFLTASISKQFTSVLILREVEKGNINLSEKANNYLKDNQKINDAITVHHLLTHTAGIVIDKLVKFTPGEKFEYSSTAYVMLGFILENVTGREFDDLAKDLLKEADMTNSFLLDGKTLRFIQKQHPELVTSFLFKNGKYDEAGMKRKILCFTDPNKKTSNKKVFFINSCCGLISTAHDLNKWNHMLHNGQILSPEMYKKITTRMIKSDFGVSDYGYGICISDNNEIFHLGYKDNYVSTLSYFPKYKISLVILENISVGSYRADFKMHEKIRNAIASFFEAHQPSDLNFN